MFHPFLRSRLFDQADPDNPGAGGGDLQDPPADRVDPQDPPKQEPLTLDAILAGITGKLPDIIKSTVAPVITTQLNGLDAKIDKRLKALEKNAPKPDPKPNDGKQDNPFWEEEKSQLNERIQALELQTKEKERIAQERELDAEIKSSLSDFPWQAPDGKASPGKEIAFDYYRAKAKRNDAGDLIIQDVPLNKFVRQHAAIHFKSYFTPREVGGSGATKGTPSKGAFDLDSIKPGMSAEEGSAAQAAIVQALNALRSS